jgi:hypothetical protein
MALWQLTSRLSEKCELYRSVQFNSFQLRISIYPTIKFKPETKLEFII